MEAWAYQYGVQLDFIRPGRPVENGYIESYMDPARAQAIFRNERNSVAVVYPACL
jgi:putative transposase